MTPDQLAQLTLAAAQEQARAARSQTAAAWVQATGAIGAIVTSIILAVQSGRREAKAQIESRLRAEAADQRAEDRAIAADAAAERRAQEADHAAAQRIRDADAAAELRDDRNKVKQQRDILFSIGDICERIAVDFDSQASGWRGYREDQSGMLSSLAAAALIQAHDDLSQLRAISAPYTAVREELNNILRSTNRRSFDPIRGPKNLALAAEREARCFRSARQKIEAIANGLDDQEYKADPPAAPPLTSSRASA